MPDGCQHDEHRGGDGKVARTKGDHAGDQHACGPGKEVCADIARAIKLQKQWDAIGVQLRGVVITQKPEGEATEDLKVPEDKETHE